MRGVGLATASSAEAMAGSWSYVTAMRSMAAVAVSSVVAATAATGSPTKRTVSGHSACSSWLTGRIPNAIGRSWPVSTAFTPGSARALVVSMPVILAWGCGLRSSLQKSIRGRARSSANLVAPVTFAVASTLRSALPMTRCAAGAFFLRAAIQAFRGRQRLEQRLVRSDADIAGLAVQIEAHAGRLSAGRCGVHPEALSRHRSPTLLLLPHRQDRPQPPPHRALAVAERFEHRVPEEARD